MAEITQTTESFDLIPIHQLAPKPEGKSMKSSRLEKASKIGAIPA
jgi:hypothetical protein